MNCGLCDEPIEYGEERQEMPFIRADGTPKLTDVHRDCIVRSVLGGIGHHLSHDYWCVGMKDPDGGRSLRQSAREVVALLREKGISGLDITHP